MVEHDTTLEAPYTVLQKHPCVNQISEVFIFLSIARFVLGVGVGGVYPLAATVAAEGSSSEFLGARFGIRNLQKLRDLRGNR